MADGEEAEIPYQVKYEGAEEAEEFLKKDEQANATISYSNGDTYGGSYLNGLRHGEGCYTFSSQKGCYTGSWAAGKKDGKGEFKYPDGARYKGFWKADKRHGKGTYYYAINDIYSGDWVEGKKSGHGSYVNAADGSKLIGTWVEGKMTEGDWEMSGATYSGKFENGQPCGKGSMKFIVEETLAHVEEGEYVDGTWVCSAKEKIELEKKYHSDRRAYQDYESDKDYPDFSGSNTWMSKVMTPELYEKFRGRVTKNGYTLDMAIQTGVDSPNSESKMMVGITAGDEESYTTFSEIFDPVISESHGNYPAEFKHPTSLEANEITHQGFEEKYVTFSHVRASRSVRGFCMASFASRAERRKVENLLKEAATTLEGPAGTYESVVEMSEERQEELVGKNLLFDKPIQPRLVSAGLARDWPDGRGIYISEKENYTIWVNEQDHCQINSMSNNGNMQETFERFCSACNGLEEEIKKLGHEYTHNEHLGYLNSCPSNIGTAMRAGCHVKIPLLSKHEKFGEITSNLRFQTCAVNAASEEGVFDVFNAVCLGLSEVLIMQYICNGIDKMIELEKALENGEDISDRIPESMAMPW